MTLFSTWFLMKKIMCELYLNPMHIFSKLPANVQNNRYKSAGEVAHINTDNIQARKML